ncbi:MAG TPA: T9SS type A sorting domain-containing protein [Ignavibacteriales bacterium]|nr:T9SS type A sorting domain-containing protein [Ignavibacteriales bacterium]
MRCFILALLLSLITLFGGISSAQTQNHNYRGNLVKINMTSKSVNLSDTLGSWIDIYSAKSSGQYDEGASSYYDHLSLNGQSYLLKEVHSSSGPYIQTFSGADILENEYWKSERSFNSTGDGWCVMSPLMFPRTQIVPAGQGAWLINGTLGNTFIYNNDSLRTLFRQYNHPHSQVPAENLVAIIGMVSDRYLAIFDNGNHDYEYRLVDLSNSPDIPEEGSTAIKFYGTPDELMPYITIKQPLFRRARRICNKLYLFQSEHNGDMHFYSFNDTSFTYIKTASGDPYLSAGFSWEFRNSKLCIEGHYTYDLNISDTTFINRKLLPGIAKTPGAAGFDRELNYAAQIDGDTLRIYDINKECYINAICIKGVNKPFKPVVDYPYVYLHQTIIEENSSILGVEKDNSIVKNYSLSAYPNPFNPVTTLEFNMPQAGQVELRIYDALGKEVTTLVNEERKEGSYKVRFNASSLPSGMYLCRMNAGKYSVTRKVILLK